VLDLRALRTVDPSAFESQARNTPFAGMRLKGWPVATIVGGKIAWKA
jgi:dihydroorotase